MTITLDCKVYSAKIALLTQLQKVFDEMYSPNYDALIDAAKTYENNLEINVINTHCFEDERNLKEVLQIMTQDNPKITINIH
ncbi:MAG: hypothetical protein K2M64_01045 [Clostridia bacterium]|nr:hypothetical protein [Clostridia bacterium]